MRNKANVASTVSVVQKPLDCQSISEAKLRHTRTHKSTDIVSCSSQDGERQAQQTDRQTNRQYENIIPMNNAGLV